MGKVTGAKGYQLQYALNKKFKKKKSIQTKKTKYTIKKLKKKKTYYIRVRAYKMNGKKKVYGKWSTVKKSKIGSNIRRGLKNLGEERPLLVVGRFTLFLYAGIWHVWYDLMFFLRGVSRLTIVSKYIDFAL